MFYGGFERVIFVEVHGGSLESELYKKDWSETKMKAITDERQRYLRTRK